MNEKSEKTEEKGLKAKTVSLLAKIVAGAILLESSLSFLGLGVQPPTASWGNILTDGQKNIINAWWLSFFPGLAIVFTALGYNLLGEGLRDLLDPKNKQNNK